MLLMIDNYDSFTYNLVQYLGELGEDVRVYRNDKVTLEEIENREFRGHHTEFYPSKRFVQQIEKDKVLKKAMKRTEERLRMSYVET